MKKNKYEILRRPGIIGSVATEWQTRLIYQHGAENSLSIYLAELAPDHWAYGYHITTPERTTELLPGEHPGWFATSNHALLYALEHIRIKAPITEDEQWLIMRKISELLKPTLF